MFYQVRPHRKQSRLPTTTIFWLPKPRKVLESVLISFWRNCFGLLLNGEWLHSFTCVQPRNVHMQTHARTHVHTCMNAYMNVHTPIHPWTSTHRNRIQSTSLNVERVERLQHFVAQAAKGFTIVAGGARRHTVSYASDVHVQMCTNYFLPRPHAHTHTHTHTHTHARTHTHTHTHTHVHVHARTHIHTRTYTHTHTLTQTSTQTSF